ncbi:hypothetical protein FHL15_001193 [Xylaria flabelliformis]|uniref:EKC/KEOPS complex subunit BUD32 n=1 Tax=Xylaria flabelliformis TaxID=2512241 RepID=A0A553ICQ3_9PEZI|nr:hypothetical protein FHL15_001193 [Xylaria flabelliformis]
MAVNLSGGQQAVLLNATTDQLKGIFVDHPLWELEQILGNGSYGVTVLLRDRGATKFGQDKTKIRKPKRVVLKRPIHRQAGIRDFENEIRAFETLSGLAHHVQAIATTADVSDYRSKSREGIRDALKNIFAPFRNPPINVFKILGHYQGPAILLEYIENGSLLSFHTKLWEKRITLPNRLLWRFYFCLVRGVCGMVFEQEKHKKGQPLVLETTPENGRHREFLHGDIASRNIMIGECDPEVEDHRITPILKYIDYGFSGPARNAEEAIRENLFNASVLILYLIHPDSAHLDFENLALEYKGIYTYAASIIPWPNGRNPCPYLDEELRDLLAEVFRVNPAQRPSIQEVFMRTQNGVAKPATSYRYREFEESDIAIDARLQQILHDA